MLRAVASVGDNYILPLSRAWQDTSLPASHAAPVWNGGKD
jgi:hypothetical protein